MNKKKLILLIVCGIMILSLSIILIFYYLEKNSTKEEQSERTVLKYVTGNITYDNALNKGRDYFINTIKLVANDYLDYDATYDGKVNLYLINNTDGYAQVKNYSLIKSFLSDESIKIYNDLVNYINYENKDYVLKYQKDIFPAYVGSIVDIERVTDNIIEFKATNYYCDDYEFVGILDNVPTCNITKETNSTFTLINENNILKINDLNEFIGTKKIY